MQDILYSNTEVLRLTGIWEKQKSKCRNLSLGMKQRLGLAIAMMGEPQLLILDEPINGLDPSGILELRKLFRRLNEEKNITILLSSHILSELQQTATTFGFLKKGRLLEEISASQLYEKCADYVEIAVSEPEKYAMLLSSQLPESAFIVLPDKTIRIFNMAMDLDSCGQLAADNGIYIKGLRKCHSSLEEYYMNLNQGGVY